MAFPDPIIVGSKSFNKIRDGFYMLSTASADQPNSLSIKSNIRASGVSDFVIRRDIALNTVGMGGLPSPDSVLQVYSVFRYDLKDWTPATVLGTYADLSTFMNATDSMSRLLQGQV